VDLKHTLTFFGLLSFNYRYGDFLNAPEKDETDYRELPQADAATLLDQSYEPTPRYWVPEREIRDRLAKKNWPRAWLMGWRDITNVTNERTVIAAAFPRVGVGNNLPLTFFASDSEPKKLGAFVGSLSSLVCDFLREA
jgi:hypothetical protein